MYKISPINSQPLMRSLQNAMGRGYFLPHAAVDVDYSNMSGHDPAWFEIVGQCHGSKSKPSQMNGKISFSELATYPYELLCCRTDLPDGIDLNHKEKHLSTEEFQRIFHMTYSEFVGLPHWKQQQLKKQLQLW